MKLRTSSILAIVLGGFFLLGIGLNVARWFFPFAMGNSGILIGWAFIGVGMTVPAMACAATAERGRALVLMRIGMAAAALGLVCWWYVSWLAFSGRYGTSDDWAKLAWWLTLTSIFCMIAGFIMRERMVSRWSRRALYVTLALLGSLLFFIALFATSESFDESTAKFLGVLGVLTVCSVLVTLILARMRQLDAGEFTEDVIRRDFTAVCPRCSKRQTLTTGGDSCASCGLNIKVIIP